MASVKFSAFPLQLSTTAPTVVGLQGGINVQYNYPPLNGLTGSGLFVGQTSPTLITPALGTPSAGNLLNCTNYPVASINGLGTGVATFLATPTSANLAAALTDETGTGGAVFATSPTIVTPTINQVNASGGVGVALQGSTNASAATAGYVGQVVTSFAASVAVVTQTSTNITSISLTAGDWDVTGNILTTPAGGTVQAYAACAINTVSAVLPVGIQGVSGAVGAGVPLGPVAPTTRINVSSTTTVFLVGNVSYSVSTLTTNGYLYARRVR